MKMLQKKRKPILATVAGLSTLAVWLIPSSAFANYYSYQRCLNNGGGYIGCLGELADVTAMSPDAKKEFNVLLEREKYEQSVILKSIKANEAICGKQEKSADQGACYLETVKRAKKELEQKRPMAAKTFIQKR